MGLIGLLVLAVIIMCVIGLVLVGLVGPFLVGVSLPPAVILGTFFVKYGWAIGVLVGLWFFFTGGNWSHFEVPKG